MRHILLALALAGALGSASARADGLLVPTDRSLPPLSLAYQRVNVAIEGQVATTSVEQVFRNSTPRDLEADYLFPLPPGATVREFAMWVNGKRLTGETIDAPKARSTYEDIVRRLKDPGLLEYVDHDLWKVRIFPVPRLGEQKIEIRFTTLLKRDSDMVAYQYPLRTGQTPRQVTGDFTMIVKIHSAEPLGPIYSPSHDVAVNRKGDHEAIVSFERDHYTLDRDFSLYFTPKSSDVGFSLLTQRESHERQGYFLLLLSPRAETDVRTAPRDLVVVLDTSHSMSGDKIRQAKEALRSALNSLKPDDKFGLIQFATVVTPFRDRLLRADDANLAEARAWVDKLEAQGATDIGSALEEALKLRPRDGEGSGRSFQVVFFTDGLPTAGQTSQQILQAVKDRDLHHVRIFTFGVGDDVDAHLLDQLAEATRAASTYVRPSESLEAKASTLVAKISHPVRTDLRLKTGEGVRLVEMYPPHLPDLFKGEQLQVAGRYEGTGHVAVTLESRIGDRTLTDTFEAHFPDRTSEHDFIAPIWARRKVGYLLDQIRLHGEKSELKDEVIRLAREFGIATPYTSMLIVPDERPRLAQGFGGLGRAGQMGGGLRLEAQVPPAPVGAEPDTGQRGQQEALRLQNSLRGAGGYGQLAPSPSGTAAKAYRRVPSDGQAGAPADFARLPAQGPTEFSAGLPQQSTVSGKAAIDLAQRLAELKTQGRLEEIPAVKTVAGRKFRKLDDTWVDERFEPGAKTVKIRAFGAAYFRLLERHGELRPILALGTHVVWVAPSGTALVVDDQGDDQVSDAVLDGLFATR